MHKMYAILWNRAKFLFAIIWNMIFYNLYYNLHFVIIKLKLKSKKK